ncbi:MAG TPA: hypothetical protein VLB84_15990 [Bacteroidia bacterium]|nr:hypothetical protein [Bacteroidia bacterium]
MNRAGYIILSVVFVIAPLIGFCGNGVLDDEVKSAKIVSTFNMETFFVKEEGFVCWTAKEEHGSLPYIVEQYIFDKWVPVGQINGIGTPTANSYSVPVTLNSGENKFRVRQKGYDKMSRFSNSISYYSKKLPVSYDVSSDNQTLVFSADTYFIIYNPYGAVMKQGYGNSLNISDYPTGYYCLIYDNRLGGFEKKKVWFKNSFCPIVINPIYLGKRKLLG